MLALIAGSRCQNCGRRLPRDFHADHVLPFAKGGRTVLRNGAALCLECNLAKGATIVSTNIKLRPWQEEVLAKAVNWLLTTATDRHFLINAAPGAGKTIAACVIAQYLFEKDEIDRVVVIAPRAEVVRQWAKDFRNITGRFMGKVTGADGDVVNLDIDVCATWASVEGLASAFQTICSSSRTLVICDEHHHAAVKAAWGNSADDAFAEAKFVLVLSGTPIRSDGEKSVWLAYDDHGRINQPQEGTYTLTYGEAVELDYCRPVTFHRHEGNFSVDLDDGQSIKVSGTADVELSQDLKRIPGLQRVLEFYRLACTPQYEPGTDRPLLSGYQASMVEYACQKLDDVRYRMPEAGGLVIAPDIKTAEYFKELIREIDGEEPIIVHNNLSGSDNRIDAFRSTNKRWIVSVAMISEGVDIPRLRVLIYLSNALTDLAFRQSIGRIVRSAGPEDDTRGYVVMPALKRLEEYARRVEEEMPATAKASPEKPKKKKCPSCGAECSLDTKECETCGHEFTMGGGGNRNKVCHACNALNPRSAKECANCGASFQTIFTLSLLEALRVGAIVRGADITEEEVREAEQMAPGFRAAILKSGDQNLVRLLRRIPEESYARLKEIISDM